MKKTSLLIFLATLLLGTNGMAQSPYTFTVQTGQAYTPLTADTSINTGNIWDRDDYTLQLPAGFVFQMDGRTISTIDLSMTTGGIFMDAASDTLNGFTYDLNSSLYDRGNVDGIASQSPISYTVDGLSPNRIFKIQVGNAGFLEEYDTYRTNGDSVNFQFWLYETSSIVELRYGTSQISYPGDYFVNNGPLVGYFKNVEWSSPSGFIYNLAGPVNNPTLDSTDNSDTSSFLTNLDSWPPDGVVYRFTPIVKTSPGMSVTSSQVLLSQVKVFPTLARESLTVTYQNNSQATYEVVSMQGSLLQHGRLQTGNNSIDLSKLAAGSYVLRVANELGNAQFKFMHH